MTAHDTHLHTQLTHLRTRLLVMCAETREAVERACTALEECNTPLAVQVIDHDHTINTLENEIDSLALSILARAQPVARDLRFLVSTLRMAVDLERIGDEAVSIAERALLMQQDKDQCTSPQLRQLMQVARRALQSALTAFQQEDMPLALQISRGSADVTQLEVRLLHDSLPNPKSTEAHSYGRQLHTMHQLLVARALTRIYGRAANIAEHAYFMVQGTSLKHKMHTE